MMKIKIRRSLVVEILLCIYFLQYFEWKIPQSVCAVTCLGSYACSYIHLGMYACVRLFTCMFVLLSEESKFTGQK